MAEQNKTSLAGQMARIVVGKTETLITFGRDVELTWESGSILNSTEQPNLHPEIKGNVEGEKDTDYRYIKDAELILDDQRVFKISFIGKTYFTAHEPISSRTRTS
jgi:hypothetical protein